MLTDPIADMLTRIRNACGAKHRRVDMPGSKMKVEIAKILKENHFIQDYRTLEAETGKQTLRVVLKYAQGGQPVWLVGRLVPAGEHDGVSAAGRWTTGSRTTTSAIGSRQRPANSRKGNPATAKAARRGRAT